ncbi:hypothetical protein cyc_00984 [Cyclospora cayetanensis]|uniref:Uncharacterized protein n=1 Tax=Cyclospora cayetanensis TaxID=88456 RepID=A0A1D3D962_9EIME|nr:hypothetical protein cyc_00984 [Cyclospora cayetanensis]
MEVAPIAVVAVVAPASIIAAGTSTFYIVQVEASLRQQLLRSIYSIVEDRSKSTFPPEPSSLSIRAEALHRRALARLRPLSALSTELEATQHLLQDVAADFATLNAEGREAILDCIKGSGCAHLLHLFRATPEIRLSYNSIRHLPEATKPQAVSTKPTATTCACDTELRIPREPQSLRCADPSEETLRLVGMVGPPNGPKNRRGVHYSSSDGVFITDSVCTLDKDTCFCSTTGEASNKSCLPTEAPYGAAPLQAASERARSASRPAASSRCSLKGEQTCMSHKDSEASALDDSAHSCRRSQKGPRDTLTVDRAIATALMRLTAASQQAAAAARNKHRRSATAEQRWPRPSTASSSGGVLYMGESKTSSSALTTTVGIASVAGDGTLRGQARGRRSCRCISTGGRLQTDARAANTARRSPEATTALQKHQQLVREQVLEQLKATLEEDEPPLEAVMQLCSGETTEELLIPCIRELRSLLRLVVEATGQDRAILAESIVWSLTSLINVLDTDIASYERYVEDLEAALFRWQQREVALQQLLQQIEQLQRLVASHERLRAEDRRKHEESVTALTERVEMLQQELARLDPDESRITEARDQHEELVELLKERAASHGVQQQLLLEAQQLLQQVASSVQQPMDTIRSRDSGRVYETKEGELCFRLVFTYESLLVLLRHPKINSGSTFANFASISNSSSSYC